MYKAKIHRNTRGIGTISPLVLLTNVRDNNNKLIRDHCYVSLKNIERFIPQESWYGLIKFEGDLIPYLKGGNQQKFTFNITKVISNHYFKVKVNKKINNNKIKDYKIQKVMDIFKKIGTK